MTKVAQFYQTDKIFNADPVPGAREGVQALRDMGYRLIIVTARMEDHEDESWKWVERHFAGLCCFPLVDRTERWIPPTDEGLFDSMICTGQFKDAHKTGHEITTKLSKSQVITDRTLRLLMLLSTAVINRSAQISVQNF